MQPRASNQIYSNGTAARVRGSPVAAYDVVDAYVDEDWAKFEDGIGTDWPAAAGTRFVQPALGLYTCSVLS